MGQGTSQVLECERVDHVYATHVVLVACGGTWMMVAACGDNWCRATLLGVHESTWRTVRELVSISGILRGT